MSSLIEIRFGGEIKRRLRDIIQDIANRFDARELVRAHYVPHISLYGPFRTDRNKVVLARLRDVCDQYDLVPFRLGGFDHFERRTIYADVHSSYSLRQLRYELSCELRDVTYDEQDYDHDRWCQFHSTVARDISEQFEDIWEYVNSEYDIHSEGYAERIALIQNGNIVKEYSVPQGRFLSQAAATSKPAWKRDATLVERYKQPDDHVGLVPSQPGRLQKWTTLFNDQLKPNEVRTRKDREFEDRPPQKFVSGDLHLNHANIIQYCDRPFDTVHEMNQKLVANWNDTVGPNDKVVFLGDLALYYGDITTHDWLHALNGDITFIRGNHDGAESIDYEEDYLLETESRRYYCTHRQEDIPDDWEGWAIHGHVHNNDVDQHPFINLDKLRINAAPELMGYTPMSMNRIEAIIEDSDTCVIPSV